MSKNKDLETKKYLLAVYHDKYFKRFPWMPEKISDISEKHYKFLGYIECLTGTYVLQGFMKLKHALDQY